MMKRKKTGKIWALIMSICLLMGAVAVQGETALATGQGNAGGTGLNSTIDQVGANETVLTLNLGTDGLQMPEQNVSTWTGSKVYLGSLKGDEENTPILWRVLSISDSEVLLQTDSILLKSIFTEAPSGTTSLSELNKWLGSEIREYLNESGTGGFLEEFDGLICDAVLQKNIQAAADTVSGDVSYSNPSNERSKVFLLSAKESTNTAYGYGTEGARRIVSGGDAGSSTSGNANETANGTDGKDSSNTTGSSTTVVTGEWWLRSAVNGSETEIAVIDADGKLTTREAVTAEDGNAVAEISGVAPALYLNSDNVVFTTPASQAKSGKVVAVQQYTGEKVWKLTLKGSKDDLNAASANGSAFERNQTIEFRFDKASGLKKGEFVPTQVSALILDESGSPVYYGKLTGSVDAAGASWKIPADMPSGDYKAYIFAEDVNDKKETDYASALGSAVSFSVAEKETPVLVTKPAASAIVYGQALSSAAISGGKVQVQGVDIQGTFSWKNPSVQPVVSDSNATEYEVVFKPADSGKYYDINLKLTMEVKKAQVASLPQQSITVDYSVDMVKKVALPDGWSWKQGEQEKALTAGIQTTATAIYRDTANFENTEYVITITRSNCPHNGDKEVRGAVSSTCTSDGYTGDTYCLNCGSLLEQGTVIGQDAHYYNNSRIVKWLGCEQQEEVEYYCSCGDSYIVVTKPALGHDFKAQITRQATTEKEGIKTYTCSRCGHAYTEAIPKLEAVNNNQSTTGEETVEARIPYVKGNKGISGWNDINKHILKAADGATIQIIMNGSFILPEKILTTVKGKNLTLQMELGQDIVWKLAGTDVTGEKLSDINLKVIKNGNGIPSDLVTTLAGERSTLTLSFVQDGDFGAKMELQVLLDSNTTGAYSNQFYYDKTAGTLNYQASNAMIDTTRAVLTIEQSGEYLVVLDSEEFDGTKEEPVDPPAEESKSEDTPVLNPVGDNTDSPQNNDGISAILIIIIGLIVLGVALLVIVVLRARSRREE